MTEQDYYQQQAEALEIENKRLMEDLAALRAHIMRIQEEAHARITKVHKELQQERARSRQQLAGDRERVRVVYKPSEKFQTVMTALPIVASRLRYAILEGDQRDEEDALKEVERWVTSATASFKENH